tara:strand:+ start:317 stop:568 length:252 start_codon:yes stop_codon:yes gene_type:complete
MAYTLEITDEDMQAIGFARGRYDWATTLSNEVEIGTNDLAEHKAWEIMEAIEADMEGGHSPFPCLCPQSDLYSKLVKFWQEIV